MAWSLRRGETSSWVAAWLAVGAGGIAVAIPAEALACSCGGEEETVVLPAAGSTGMPTNAKAWIDDAVLAGLWRKTGVEWRRQCESEAPSILRDDGEPIPSVITELNYVLVLSPTEPLLVGRSYQIQGCGGYFEDLYSPEKPLDLGTFSVDRDADVTKPGLPVVEIGESDYYDGETVPCAEHAYVEATWSADEPGWLLVDVAGSADLDLEDLSGHVSGVVSREEFRIGRGLCDLGAGWGDAAPGATTEVSFGVLDVAGNFSGWTDPIQIEIEEGCACGMGSPQHGLVALMILPLLALRRRAEQ